jgi:DNA-binding transcriptional LysR family regulator
LSYRNQEVEYRFQQPRIEESAPQSEAIALNTKSLRIFVEVANTGSFSAAARNLGLTQPAVSFQIRTLEKEYDNTLIDRSMGHCRLTEAGSAFLKKAQGILDKEEELQREMMERRSEISGQVNIAASNIPGEYILPYILTRFRQRFPLTDPQLVITDSGRVLESGRAGEVDLGATGYYEEDERLEYGVLCEDRLVFIAPPDHPLTKHKNMKPRDLEGEELLWREEGSGTRSHMNRILVDLGLEKTIEGSIGLGSTMAVIQAVAAGAGISLISLWAADAYIRLGKVAELNLKGHDFKRQFFHVTLRRRPSSPQTSALLKLLEEERPNLDAKLRAITTR